MNKGCILARAPGGQMRGAATPNAACFLPFGNKPPLGAPASRRQQPRENRRFYQSSPNVDNKSAVSDKLGRRDGGAPRTPFGKKYAALAATQAMRCHRRGAATKQLPLLIDPHMSQIVEFVAKMTLIICRRFHKSSLQTQHSKPEWRSHRIGDLLA